jgi:hypothetical protein
MKLRIELELGNAAFTEGGPDEVEHILASLAGRLPDPLAPTNGELSLHDSCGNWVGYARITGGKIRNR